MPPPFKRLRSAGAARAAIAAVLFAALAGGDAAAQTVYAPLYIPTPDEIVGAMLELGGAGAGDVVYDLGSGDGRIVVAAARLGARAVGVEYDPQLVDRSWALADSAGVTGRVDFRVEDLFSTDVGDADIVTLYLSHAFNLRLRPRLLDRLRPGSRIVSHAFHMGDWEPDSTVTLGEGAGRATLYAWTIPADVDGFWLLEIEGASDVALELRQSYQRLAGDIRRAGRSLEIADGRMTGDTVRFTAVERVGGVERELRFRGVVRGTEIVGTIEGPGTWRDRPWRATRFSSAANSEGAADQADRARRQ